MKKTRYLFLSLFVMLSFTMQPFSSSGTISSSSTTTSWGTIRYPTIPNSTILRHNFDDDWTPTKIAQYQDVWQGHYYCGEEGNVAAIHAINPNIKCFIYYNLPRVWTDGIDAYSGQLGYFRANNLLLKTSGGVEVRTSSGSNKLYADIFSNTYGPTTRHWIATFVKSAIDTYGFDGVSFDNCFMEDVFGLLGFYPAYPIDPDTGAAFTNAKITSGYIATMQEIRNHIGSNKLIVTNSAFRGSVFFNTNNRANYENYYLHSGINGVMCEFWIVAFGHGGYDASAWVSEDYWKLGIDYSVWLEDNFAPAGGKYFVPLHLDTSFAGSLGIGGDDYPTDMTVPQYEQFALYGYASRLLTVKNLDTMMCFGNYISRPFAQALFKINIGSPSGDYYKSGNLYVREFTNGMVIVNPTSTSYTISVGSGYKHAVDGISVSSSLTALPHTGIILKRV